MRTNHPLDLDIFETVVENPADPPAASPIILVIEPHCYHSLQTAVVTLETDATAGDRYLYIELARTGEQPMRFYAPERQPASLIYHYYFFHGYPFRASPSVFSSRILCSFGIDNRYPLAEALSVGVVNMQAADQLSNCAIWRRVWVQGTIR